MMGRGGTALWRGVAMLALLATGASHGDVAARATAPRVLSFDAAVAHVDQIISSPFGPVPVELFVPVISARVADSNGVETIDSVRVFLPNGGVHTFAGSPGGRYELVLPPLNDFSGGTFGFRAVDADGLTSKLATDEVGPVTLPIPRAVSPLDKAVEVALSPTLDWDDMKGASGYVVNINETNPITFPPDAEAVERFLDPATSVVSYLDAATKGSDLRIPLGRLKPNTTYYWVVGAIDKVVDPDHISLSKVRSFTTKEGVIVADTTAPVFLAKPEVTGIDEKSFVVAWRTNERSDSRVYYSTSAEALVSSVVDDRLTMDHRVAVTGLESGTEYFVAVASRDFRNNEVYAVYPRAVVTKQTADTSPPVFIAGPIAQRVAEDRVTVFWITNEPTVAEVRVVGSGKDTTVSDPALRREHGVSVLGLTGGTPYTFQVSVWDAAGNGPVTSGDTPFLTKTRPDNSSPRFLKGPAIIPGRTEALIMWTANELHTARVILLHPGPQGALIKEIFIDEARIVQFARIGGLRPKTRYRAVVVATDLTQNATKSRPLSFRTLAGRDTIPPRILRAPALAYRADTRVVLEWVTDEPADSYAELRQAGQLVATFSNGAFVRVHRLLLTDLASGDTYDFVIRSADASGNEVVWPPSVSAKSARSADRAGSTFSTSPTPDLTPPSITAAPTILASTATSLTIGWETDEISNSVTRFGAASGTKPARGGAVTFTDEVAETDNVTSHTMTITGLEPGATYNYEVGSTDPSGNGETTSGTATTTTLDEGDFAPPNFIEQPAVIGRTDTRITLRWTTDEPSDTKVRYKLSGAPDDDELVIALAENVTEHVVTITNLQPSKTYDLTTESTDLVGNGPATAQTSGTTEADPDTAPPRFDDGPTVITDASQAHLVWTTDEPSDSYVEYGETSALGQVASITSFDTRHDVVLTNLQPNTQYHFGVASSDAAGNIADSSGTALVWTTLASPDTDPPAKVAGAAAEFGAYAVRLTWSANTDVDLAGYLVERSDASGPFNAIAAPTGTAYLDQTITPGTTYEYRIRAKDISANGNLGEPSDTLVVTPTASDAPGAPTAFPHDTTVSGRPTLTVANAQANSRPIASYVFVVASDSLFTQVVASAADIPPGETNTAWVVPFMLDHLGVYWWAARATDAGGFQGAFSARTSFVVDTVAKKTAVKLASFAAHSVRQHVELTWTVGRAGPGMRFDVWRASGRDDDFVKLTTRPLSGKGADYTFLDRRVVPGVLYRYRLEALEPSGATTVFGPLSVRAALPERLTLEQNVPNPFNPTTQIAYQLPWNAEVTLVLYDVLGQRVRHLVREAQSAGVYRITWDGTNDTGAALASGVYFARLAAAPRPGSTADRTESRVIRMLLVR